MRSTLLSLIALFALSCVVLTADAQPVIKKTLRHYLDAEGRHTKSPSLLDRDAYQVYLREHPEEISGLRFDVQLRLSKKEEIPLTLKIEVRHGKGTEIGLFTKKSPVVLKKRRRSQWTNLIIDADAYKEIGEIIAWRISLWNGAIELSHKESFLW